MPNTFAYVMLLVWPLAALALFRFMPVERALIWTLLGGYLILPQGTEFDFPMIPALDKATIPNIVAFLICYQRLGSGVLRLPQSRIIRSLLVLFLISPIMTVRANGEPILFELGGGIPGLSPYDAISYVVNQAFYVLPFFLARRLLVTETAQRELLWALMAAGLLYSVPMLIEIRLSPQLHNWIYGFMQHSFLQMIRDGGYRPMVFLYHGLLVGFLTMTAFISALALWRAAPLSSRAPYLLAGGWLALMLVLCKSLGALLYGLVLVPLVLFVGRRLQIRIAVLLALLTISYPLLRGADLVPVDAMLAQAAAVSEERAQSLGVRFQNEAELLAHASEKILFGWGGWGRNVIYNPYGKSDSITDGRWIIVIGVFGWCGYLVEFGLLTLPILFVARQISRVPSSHVTPYVGALALLHGINLIDLLPNASLTPFTWLIAGALFGHAELLRSRGAQAEPALNAASPRKASRTIL